MKSEQAEPRFSAYDGDFVKWFTASETAQIAKAYARTKYVFSESLRRYKNLRIAGKNADHYYYLANKAHDYTVRWENLFAEWQK